MNITRVGNIKLLVNRILILFISVFIYQQSFASTLNNIFSVSLSNNKVSAPVTLHLLPVNQSLPVIPYLLPGQEIINFAFKSSQILDDVESRISKNFQVPENFKKRVGFWLSIYTQYDSNISVIHDTKYPWIVYETFNLKKEMLGQGAYWARYHKAKKKLAARKKYWRKTLKSASRSKNKYCKDELKVKKSFKSKRSLLAATKRIRSQTGQKDHFLKGLKRSAAHLHNMEDIFTHYNLPIELTRLPLVESSFNAKAYSKAGAKGIWQIMPIVGRKLGIVKGKKDLRGNIKVSTRAAAKLFKQKHRSLRHWPLTITSYNHGPSGVKRAVRKLGTKDIAKIVDKYKSRRFGFASQNFYASFLAALYSEQYKDILFDQYKKQASYQPLDRESIYQTF